MFGPSISQQVYLYLHTIALTISLLHGTHPASEDSLEVAFKFISR